MCWLSGMLIFFYSGQGVKLLPKNDIAWEKKCFTKISCEVVYMHICLHFGRKYAAAGPKEVKGYSLPGLKASYIYTRYIHIYLACAVWNSHQSLGALCVQLRIVLLWLICCFYWKKFTLWMFIFLLLKSKCKDCDYVSAQWSAFCFFHHEFPCSFPRATLLTQIDHRPGVSL